MRPSGRLRTSPALRSPVVAGAFLIFSGCAPEPAGEQAEAIKGLYDIFGVVAAVVFVVVVGLIGVAIVRFRERPRDDGTQGAGGLPKQTRGNVRLEVLWFAVPQAIVIALFVLSMVTQSDVNAEAEDPDVTIETVAFQWGWRFTYVDQDITVEGRPQDPAEVVVPVDRDLRFDLEAADVDHAFYVPRFLIKRDVIPGRLNHLDVTIDDAGTYKGVCAEYCGVMHDRMTFTVRAVSPESFEQWAENAQEGS